MTLEDIYDFNLASEIIIYIKDAFKNCDIREYINNEVRAEYLCYFVNQETFIEFDIDLDDETSAININTELGLERVNFTNKEIYAIIEAVKNDI